jgi:hypothetical protein
MYERGNFFRRKLQNFSVQLVNVSSVYILVACSRYYPFLPPTPSASSCLRPPRPWPTSYSTSPLRSPFQDPYSPDRTVTSAACSTCPVYSVSDTQYAAAAALVAPSPRLATCTSDPAVATVCSVYTRDLTPTCPAWLFPSSSPSQLPTRSHSYSRQPHHKAGTHATHYHHRLRLIFIYSSELENGSIPMFFINEIQVFSMVLKLLLPSSFHQRCKAMLLE